MCVRGWQYLVKIPALCYKRRQHGHREAHLSQDSSSKDQTQSFPSYQKLIMMLLGRTLCLLLMLTCGSQIVKSRTRQLDSCSVNVHTQELRKYYSIIRSNAITGDRETRVKLLERSLIENVQDGQTCCLLRLVLRFYVERVFSNYISSEPQHQRASSALANAFVSIRREINKCHCHCTEETQRTVDFLHSAFIKLEINQAARKAVGELDTVLEWLEGLQILK